MVRSVAESHEKGKVAACWRRLLASFVERVDWNFPAPQDDFRGSLPSLERASQTTREGFCGPSPNFSQLEGYAALVGVQVREFSLADRQVLGHHLDRPSISALTYGRANFLAPLAKLAKWLELISQGKFRPDDNASAIIAQQLAIEESQSDGHEKSAHGEPEVCDDSASDDMAQDEAEAAAACIVPAPERKVVDGPSTESIERPELCTFFMPQARSFCAEDRKRTIMRCHHPNRCMDFQCVSLARKPVRHVRALEALRQVDVSLESLRSAHFGPSLDGGVISTPHRGRMAKESLRASN